MVFFRKSQNTKCKLSKLYYEARLYLLCRKYGIEVKTHTQIGKGFVMINPYNITISPGAKIGKYVNIMKGATIGISPSGSHKGAPTIGDCVYIGLNSTVVGGITVGEDVLIAPNTLVNRDVPDHSIVIGSPCKNIPRDNATKGYVFYKV